MNNRLTQQLPAVFLHYYFKFTSLSVSNKESVQFDSYDILHIQLLEADLRY